ncbi:MAG TPA: ATP-binding cassette domain-containing protein [Methanoregulaceae archaeon]|nr:ATP-binding cassette domain-containing protein [Methanoregulaceae archaeon]
MQTAIEFTDVRYSYPQGPCSLQGISLKIRKGRKVALVGPNGAGKTTLLLMCNGILRPDSGDVKIDGEPLVYSTKRLRDVRRRVGFVFQNSDSQIFAPTIFQDVAFGPLNLGMEKQEIKEVVGNALFCVGLSGYENRPPHHLSGGEKKRVAIAGVLAMEPDILIFDEPTSSLDPASAEEIMDLLDELNTLGKTIVISTHDVVRAFEWADEVILISGGRILHHGPPETVFTNHDQMKESRLTMPPLLELFCELEARGIRLGDGPPSGVLEMVHRIENIVGRPVSVAYGSIFIADAERENGDTIRDAVREKGISWTGAMGTRAKILAQEDGISLDFTYGVIDKSLLKTIVGDNALIITSGGMITRVFDRVEKFCMEHDLHIPFLLLR